MDGVVVLSTRISTVSVAVGHVSHQGLGYFRALILGYLLPTQGLCLSGIEVGFKVYLIVDAICSYHRADFDSQRIVHHNGNFVGGLFRADALS